MVPLSVLNVGHKESRETIFYETKRRNKDPWSNVLQIMTCGKCQSQIPAHLGERWDGLSVDDAKKEWKKVYREKGQKSQIVNDSRTFDRISL